MLQTPVRQALLVLTLTLALGVCLGLAMRSAPPPRQEELVGLLKSQHALLEALPARLAAEAGSQQVRCAAAPSSEAGQELAGLRAELARLREELGQACNGQPAPPAPEPAREPSPQAVAARQQSHQLIEDATRSGRWRTEDARALRQALSDMDPAQRREVIQRLIVLINTRKLESQVQGPLF